MSVMFEKMCRTCLAADTAMLSLFSSHKSGENSQGPSSIAGMLSSFASVTISESDGLPKQACLSCISEINRAYFFKIKCENSQNTLKGYVQQTTPTNETSEAEKDATVCQDVKMECDDEVLLFEAPINPDGPQLRLAVSASESEPEAVENDSRGYIVEKIVKCRECSQVFDSIQQFDSHFPDCSKCSSSKTPKKSSLKCPLCPISFLENKSCLRHFLTCHPTELPSALVETVFNNETEENENCEEEERQNEHVSTIINQPKVPLQNDNVQRISRIYRSNNDSETEESSRNLTIRNVNAKQTINIEMRDKGEPDRYAIACTVCSRTFDSSNEFLVHLQGCRKKRKSTRNANSSIERGRHAKNLEVKIEHPNENNDGQDEFRQKARKSSRKTRKSTPNKGLKNVISRKSNQQRLPLTSYRKRTNHDKKLLECRFCKKSYISKKRLDSHLIEHKDETDPSKRKENTRLQAEYDAGAKNQCILCLKAFLSRKVLKAHLGEHIGDKLTCIVCQKNFSTMEYLRAHLKRHSTIRPFKCDQCEKGFITRGELNHHVKNHVEKPFTCTICRATFKGNTQLEQHQQTHSEERPFACQVCPMRFYSIGNRRNHMSVHSDQKPFRCEICDKTFSRNGDCKKHIITHNNT